MTASAPAAEKSGGLSTVISTIAAPNEAFETLRAAPTWGWACIIALVLMLAGSYLQGPATRHAAVATMQRAVTTSSLFANMKPADKQAAIERSGKPSVFTYVTLVFVLFFAVFFNTIFMLIGNAIGRGQADFKRLWSGSMNIAVPTLGIGALVLGIILAARGPDGFTSNAQIYGAMPGLGMLAPQNSPVLAGFLSAITIFSVWGVYLNATMLRVTAKTGSGVAWTMAIVVLLLGALTTAAFVAGARNMGLG